MITGFAKQTNELTDYELGLIEPVILGLSLRDKSNPITGKRICEAMNAKGYNISEPRLRKIINYIRRHSLLFVVATSDGYYSTHDRDTMITEIQSLEQRASAIQTAADGLRRIFDSV